MLLNLAGLSILKVEADDPAAEAVDLVWRHRRRQDLRDATIDTDTAGAAMVDRECTTHCFGHHGRDMCRFDVDAAGRSVASWAISGVSDRDLLALFGEHILRSVLARRALTSFHAASLTNSDGAILIIGDKGMGKSTLSSALQHRGWTTIADDLSRVENCGGHWRTFPGLRDTKLLPDSAEAIGLHHQALPPRWDDSGDAADGNKRLLAPAQELPSNPHAFRIDAVLVLKERRAAATLSHRIAPAHDAVRHLLHHATSDMLVPVPSPPVQRAIGGLVGRIPVLEVALPDSLAELHSAAEAIETLMQGLSVAVDG